MPSKSQKRGIFMNQWSNGGEKHEDKGIKEMKDNTLIQCRTYEVNFQDQRSQLLC